MWRLVSPLWTQFRSSIDLPWSRHHTSWLPQLCSQVWKLESINSQLSPFFSRLSRLFLVGFAYKFWAQPASLCRGAVIYSSIWTMLNLPFYFLQFLCLLIMATPSASYVQNCTWVKKPLWGPPPCSSPIIHHWHPSHSPWTLESTVDLPIPS